MTKENIPMKYLFKKILVEQTNIGKAFSVHTVQMTDGETALKATKAAKANGIMQIKWENMIEIY